MLKLSLLNNPNKSRLDNRRCFLVEITDGDSSWFVLKRFKQFREFKKYIEDKYPYKLPEFPKRCLVNSYTNETLKTRCNLLQSYFDSLVVHNNRILIDPYVDQFIRSDLYLESYEDVQMADKIRKSLKVSDNIMDKIETMLEEGNNLGDEIKTLSKNHVTLINSLEELKKQFVIKRQSLETYASNKKTEQRARGECIRSIQSTSEELDILRQRLCLVRINDNYTSENLLIYREKCGKLLEEVSLLDKYINSVNCKFVNNIWHAEDYRVIIGKFEDKINVLLRDISSTQRDHIGYFDQ